MIRIGIDLGGTDIKVGAVSEEGKLIAWTQTKTGPERPYTAIIADMAACIRKLLGELGLPDSEIAAIGIGVPGVADNERGHAVNCTNLGWLDVPCREEMARYFSCPVLLENDANAAAYAEYCVGVSAGCSSSILITLGTGVGSGIVLNGRPWGGFQGLAGEVGHMTLVPDGLPCNCGRSGCVERYCSATALMLQAKQVCLTHPGNGILALAGGDPQKITAKLAVDAAKAGDPVALRIFHSYARYLALTIDNVINFLNPEMIVLGGGVSRAGAFLLDTVKSYIPPCELGLPRQLPRIVLASLGNEAGMIGAAMLYGVRPDHP